jgi:hypothetical protein
VKDDASRFQPIPGFTNLVLDTWENRNVHLDVYGRPMVPDDTPLKTFELIPFDQIKFDGKEEWRVKGLLPRQGVPPFLVRSRPSSRSRHRMSIFMLRSAGNGQDGASNKRP